jgi:hypothetical protein
MMFPRDLPFSEHLLTVLKLVGFVLLLYFY